MTFEQTKEQFLIAYNSNAYLNMCESDDMHNAISALEKQIPKKPIKHGFNPLKLISTVSYTCPNCNRHISITPYCDKCGQALLWERSDNNGY